MPDELLSYPDEEWKPISGFEECYQVSNYGRVKSSSRMVNGPHGFKTKHVRERILKSADFDGYRRFTLNYYNDPNGKVKTFRAHRLVAMHFIDNPLNHPYINHKDLNRSNNHVSNLEWCTQQQNMDHFWSTGLGKVGEGASWSKLTEDHIRDIRRRFQAGETKYRIAKDYNISWTAIHRTIIGRTWSHVK